MNMDTEQRNYVSLIYWRRGRSGFIEPKAILYNQSSIFFTFSPSPEGFTSSSTAASSDGRKNLMKSSSVLRYQLFNFWVRHITKIQISREFIIRLDIFAEIVLLFVKWSPSSGVVDDGIVRLEQLESGEATHLLTQHQHVVSFLRHDVHLHKLYRDSGELVGGHIDLGDDDGVVVLEVLAQLVPNGS